MIRKILFFTFLLYSVAWFATAHIIKGNIATAINNSETDNIKLSYKQIKVSGFPGRLQILLTAPTIKFIDHINSKEITTDQITFILDLSFKKAKVVLAKDIIQVENIEQNKLEYIVKPIDPITALVKFNKPIYQFLNTDRLQSMIKLLQINNKLLSITHTDKEIANIADLYFLISQIKATSGHDILLQVGLVYSALNDFFNFKKAALNFSILTNILEDEHTKVDTLKSLDINHLQLNCDDNAQIYLTGGLKLTDTKLPTGKLSFELTNYHNVIEALIPSNLLLPKKILKIIIEQAANVRPSSIVKAEGDQLAPQEKIKLDINFSKQGIYIGAINLLEFNLEENKGNNNQSEPENPIDGIEETKQID